MQLFLIPVTDTYTPFDELTRLALVHAVQEAGVNLGDDAIRDIMGTYKTLSPFVLLGLP